MLPGARTDAQMYTKFICSVNTLSCERDQKAEEPSCFKYLFMLVCRQVGNSFVQNVGIQKRLESTLDYFPTSGGLDDSLTDVSYLIHKSFN